MTAIYEGLEARAEVESLEQLHHERRELIKEWKPLAAKFKGGQSASADTKRKQHRATVMTRIRAGMETKDGKEPSETMLERMANAEPEHKAYVAQLDAEYERYLELDNEISEINERIRNREICLNVYNAELRLSR